MKILWIVAISCGFCACRKNDAVANDLATTSRFGSLSRLASQGQLVSLLVGHQPSITMFESLSQAARATLFITVENREFETQRGHYLRPLSIPLVKMEKSDTFVSQKNVQDFTFDKYKMSGISKEMAVNLGRLFGGDDSANKIVLPIHPDSTKHHPLVDKLLEQGATLRSSEIEAYHSMSRSLFVLNGKDSSIPTLFTLKMGTNVVNSSSQEAKLLGLHEEVTQLNRLTSETSIPSLMESFGLPILMDAVGVHTKLRGVPDIDFSQHYGFTIRDYSPVLRDKSYVYLPLDVFRGKGVPKGDYVTWVLDQNVELAIEVKYLKKYVQDLAYESGKFDAIFLGNGMSTDFLHGQNGLVGIPLDPNLRAKFAIRDISDSEDFLPMLKERPSDIPRPVSHNWCTVLRGCRDVDSRCLAVTEKIYFSGFADAARKITFHLPKGLDWQHFKEARDLHKMLMDPTYAHHFAAQVEQVRGARHQFDKKTRDISSCAMASRDLMHKCMGN